MSISSKLLREHIERRELVSIRRARIDSCSIQGFVLAASRTLVLLQYVYDFQLDGFMVLRRADMTGVKAGKADQFQNQLLADEGILAQVNFDYRAPIESYNSFLAALSPNEIVIVEDEISEPERFLIGGVSQIDESHATIRHFTGAGRIVEPHETISIDQITSCQVGTNYARVYQRYFERIKQSC